MQTLTRGKFTRREQILISKHEQACKGKDLLNRNDRELRELHINRVRPLTQEIVIARHALTNMGR